MKDISIYANSGIRAGERRVYFKESENSIKTAAKITMLVYIASLNYLAIVAGRIADIFFIAYAICASLYALTNGIERRRFNRVGFFILGIMILLAITFYRAPNISAARIGSWTIIQLLVFDFFLMITVEKQDDIRNCLLAYVIGTYIMMGAVLARTGIRFLSVLPTWRFMKSAEINVNSIGAAAGYTVVILLLFFREEHKKIYLYLMLLPFLFVFASASRAAMLIVIFGLVVSVLYSGTRGSVIKTLIVIGGIIIIYQLLKMFDLFSAFSIRFDQLLSARGGIDNSDGSTKSRYELLLFGLSEMKKRPLFGYGPGQFRYLAKTGHYIAAHNGIVHIGHAFGLTGLFFWYGNMLHSISRIITQVREGPEYWIGILAIVQIIMCISSQPLTTKTSHLLLILLFIASVLVENSATYSTGEKDNLLRLGRGYIR